MVPLHHLQYPTSQIDRQKNVRGVDARLRAFALLLYDKRTAAAAVSGIFECAALQSTDTGQLLFTL